MILTTTNSIENYKIIEYIKIVSATAVNMEKMMMTFNMQKYYTSISEGIAEVKEAAFTQLKENAEKINANAIVGIQVDIEIKSSDSLIVVSVTGTAVNIIKQS